MKNNVLQLCLLGIGVSMIPRATLSAADSPPSASSTTAVPANPFGPKPTAPATSVPPASATSSTTQAKLNTTPLPPAQFIAAVHALLLERFDKNKDGTLDAAELAEAEVLFSDGRSRRAGLNGVVPAGPLYGLRPQIMNNFGKGNNETLSEAEIAQLRAYLYKSAPVAAQPGTPSDVLRQEILKQFDKNGDGQLSDTELAAAKAQLQLIFAELANNNPAKPTGAPRPVTPPAKAATAAPSAATGK